MCLLQQIKFIQTIHAGGKKRAASFNIFKYTFVFVFYSLFILFPQIRWTLFTSIQNLLLKQQAFSVSGWLEFDSKIPFFDEKWTVLQII